MNNLVFFDEIIDIFSTFIVFVLGGLLINKTAKLLYNNNVIGWFQYGMECC